MKDGFPLLTTKKMHWKGIVTELLWILRGDTNIKYLVDNDCHIWNGDAYKRFYNETQKGLDSMFLKNEGPNKIVPFTQEEFVNKIKTDDEFAKKWGDLGPVYGKQWREWKQFIPYDVTSENCKVAVKITDQIANLIHDLKTNPDSRRLMVNAWNVGELEQQVLPPCHYSWQVYTRELSETDGLKKINLVVKYKGNNCKIINCHNANPELLILETPEGERIIYENQLDEPIDYSKFPTRAISLMWNQRSCDFPLGIPYNIASYALLLEIIGKMVNMIPDELIGNLGDCHIYLNQIEGCEEQIGRYLEVDERVCMCYENPKLDLSRIQEGMSNSEFTKVCDEFGIPTRTREPFELPKLVFGKTDEFFKSLSDDLSLITHLDNTDFNVENYQSHPTIKFPLSN
jgi:thymidylate synthase